MKILIMRFMGLGDVASILLPAVKLIKQQTPDAEVDVLTFGAGIELMQMVPQVHAYWASPRSSGLAICSPRCRVLSGSARWCWRRAMTG